MGPLTLLTESRQAMSDEFKEPTNSFKRTADKHRQTHYIPRETACDIIAEELTYKTNVLGESLPAVN